MSRAALLRVPLRIDFCGGFTDVPEIARVTGTSIVNAAVDLYQDAERTQPLAFAVELRRPGAPPHPHTAADAIMLARFSEYLGHELDACRDLRIHRDLPVSTGLGSSGALSVMLTAAWLLSRSASFDIHDLAARARDFECRFLGLTGGYQDYLSAAAGGCHHFAAGPEEHAPRVGRRCLPAHFAGYLDHSALLIVAPRPCRSSTILVDMIGRLESDADLNRRLRAIKACNDDFVCALAADDLDAGLRIIVATDELRRGISRHTHNPALDTVREELGPLCRAVHESGAGGSALVVYPREDALVPLSQRLDGLKGRLGVSTFYPKHNPWGLRISENAT